MIASNIMKHLLINLFLILNICLSNIPDISDKNWIEIQTESIEIDYMWKNGLPWCKSKIYLNYSIDIILDIKKI